MLVVVISMLIFRTRAYVRSRIKSVVLYGSLWVIRRSISSLKLFHVPLHHQQWYTVVQYRVEKLILCLQRSLFLAYSRSSLGLLLEGQICIYLVIHGFSWITVREEVPHDLPRTLWGRSRFRVLSPPITFVLKLGAVLDTSCKYDALFSEQKWERLLSHVHKIKKVKCLPFADWRHLYFIAAADQQKSDSFSPLF